MKKTHGIILTVSAFAVGFALFNAIGGNSFLNVNASSGDKVNNYSYIQDTLDKPDFPRNKSGQTYGETFNVAFENYPDLIGVIATNGMEGYAYKEDLIDEYVPQSPEEAVEYMNKLEELNNQGIFFQVIPVYKSDGKTVIGEFEMSIDVSFNIDKSLGEEEVNKLVLEREKLYEESRKQGKVLRESIKTIMEEVQ